MTNDSQALQTATADFFIPITLAYVAVCLTWLLVRRKLQSRWPDETVAQTDRKWLDLGLVFVAAIGVFAIGSLYRADLLIPKTDTTLDPLISAINLCLPYAPIFAILISRRQSLSSVWISSQSLHWKFLAGMIAAVIGTVVFLSCRSEWHRLPHIVADSFTIHSMIHAPAVFLEAVAVAFVFVRLGWITGPTMAVLIGALLFAAGHIPSSIESGRTTIEIISFLCFNTALAAFIFSVVVKSRDVIWIAIPHYFLDIAIGAFR